MNRLFLITILLVTFVPKSSACSCNKALSIKKSFKQSEAVFIGTVESVQLYEGTKEVIGSDSLAGFYHREVKFNVTKWFKGTEQNVQFIYTGVGGSDCGRNFQTGKEYLVYAKPGGLFIELQSKLQTSICDRTQILNEFSKDLDKLQRLK